MRWPWSKRDATTPSIQWVPPVANVAPVEPPPVAVPWVIPQMPKTRRHPATVATDRSMKGYRESGVVDFVEVLNEDCCETCRATYPGRIPVATDVRIPVPGCTRRQGCTCCVVPVIDDLGE